VTVVIGRDLAQRGVSSATALGLRFGISAVLLLLLQVARRGSLLPTPGERLATVLLGAVGYGIESTCFYSGLERGSAAAVGLLFYSYPAIVTVIELVTGELRVSAPLLTALGLSVVGVVLVVGAGEEVTVTPVGAMFAFLAAVTFSLYFIGSHRFVRHTPPQVTAVWVSAGAALSMVVRGVATSTLHRPSGVWVQLVSYAVANCVAFALMFAALRRLGPTRTAVLLTVEMLGTVALAAAFLDETLRGLQLVGGIAIATGAVLAARGQSGIGEPSDSVDADGALPEAAPP
jgi:drug/metabolite transporter (DMT)-like permease